MHGRGSVPSLALLAVAALPQDWPQWGGPARDFAAPAGELADAWPAEGPRVLWRRDLGDGYSSLALVDGTLFTMLRRDENEVVVALDAATGATLWEFRSAAPLPAKFDREVGLGPDATPLVVGERVFTVGTTVQLHALDRRTGKEAWAHDLRAEYGADFGTERFSTSPIAIGELLVLPCGGPSRGVLAFRLDDGRLVWKRHDFPRSPASPITIELGGARQLVCFTGEAAVGLDPTSGDLLWSSPHATKWGLNICTPVWGADGLLFLGSAYDSGSEVLELTRAEDSYRVERLWSSRTKLRVHHGNVLRIDDHLYGSSGDTNPAFLQCIDVRSGELAWQERGFAKATLVRAGEKVVLLDEDGTLALVRLSPEKLEVLARAPLLSWPARTPPTLVGTRLYLRDWKEVIALDLGG